MEGQEGWEGETWNNYPIMAVSPGTLEAQGSDALITFTALHTGRCLVAGYDSQGKMIKFLMPTVTSGDKVNLTLTGGGGAAGVKIFYLTNMEYQPKCNAVELKKI